MIGEAVRQLQRVRRRRAHAHVEGAQIPGSDRNASNGCRIMPCLLANRPRSRAKRVGAREAERAGQDVGMPVEIFGRRVHDHVGAEGERPA